jgi:hypothetical protein
MCSFIPLASRGVRDSAVGRATRYGLDGPGIEHRWCQTGPKDHPASCTVGTGYFLGVKRPKRGADHSPPSSVGLRIPWVKVKQYLDRPGQALGSTMLRLPGFLETRHKKMERLLAQRTGRLQPLEISLVLISVRWVSQPQSHSTNLPACSTVPQSTAPPPTACHGVTLL